VKYRESSYGDFLIKFVLKRNIGGYSYLFKLMPHMGMANTKDWTLAFKTEDYGYAVTNLSDSQRAEVFQTLSSFFDSIYQDTGGGINYIEASPADTSYTAEEMEDCLQGIIQTPGNKLSREELIKHYPGIRLFELYKKVTGKQFGDKRITASGGGKARSRLFRTMFKKYLENWHVDEKLSGLGLYLRHNSWGE